MADTLIERVLNKDFSALKDDMQKVIDTKIQDRINTRKDAILKTLSGVTETESA